METRLKLLEYWRFYWPLTLTGLAMVLAHQFQNGVLARYPEAVKELAIYAIASSMLGLFHAGLNFTSQLSNVYARSREGKRITQQFVGLWSVVLTLPVATLAFSPAGPLIVSEVFSTDSHITERVIRYMALLSPLVIINGQRLFLTGLLIQSRLTRWVTVLNILYLVTVIGVLVVGFAQRLSPTYTLVTAQIVASCLHWGLSAWISRKYYQFPDVQENFDLKYHELFSFFLPATMTGFMFAISRPVLFAFIARTPEALLSIAAMRIAFDVASAFQGAANQFRHFFVTFGLEDLQSKQLFMVLVGSLITFLMVLLAVTPLSTWIFTTLLGVDFEVRNRALDVMLVMCLMPALIIWRNYYHGILMVKKRTNSMAVGSFFRVLGIYALAHVYFENDWLNHVSATGILIAGFLFETIVVAIACRRSHP